MRSRPVEDEGGHIGFIRLSGGNRLKVGLFGANCSSGRTVTMIEDRWTGNWADCLDVARLADDAGIDFMLPIARWKGYGGSTDYQGESLETLTWASALLAATRRITVFGTVHAPLFNPLIAAKQAATADQVGSGRFGLNVVCGWNEGEFDMFGVSQREHAARYQYAQEWLEIVKRAWSEEKDWSYDGAFFKLKGVRMGPAPFGSSRPVIMNAGASPEGRAFAFRNCDAFFTSVHPTDREKLVGAIKSVKEESSGYGKSIDVYTIGVVTCRSTRREAEEYHRYVTEEHADWKAIEEILAMRGIYADKVGLETYDAHKRGLVNGLAGLPMIGDPDDVASSLVDLSHAGFSGIGLSFINFGSELTFFAQEVLPRLERMGVRERVK